MVMNALSIINYRKDRISIMKLSLKNEKILISGYLILGLLFSFVSFLFATPVIETENDSIFVLLFLLVNAIMISLLISDMCPLKTKNRLIIKWLILFKIVLYMLIYAIYNFLSTQANISLIVIEWVYIIALIYYYAYI